VKRNVAASLTRDEPVVGGALTMFTAIEIREIISM
jgi:hypothetical protein